jgi:ribosomal protein L40E
MIDSTTSFGIWMSKAKKKRRAASPYREPAPAAAAATEAPDDTEVRVGGILAWALPLATVVAAIAVGLLASMGPALLVMLGGAILGAVMLLWGSVRTLTGDAALTPALATAAIRERVTDAQERKRRVLRALKDLDHERDVGKIDADDYEKLSSQYRDDAKAILREIDVEIEPRREKAEEIVRKHLGQREPVPAPEPEAEPVAQDDDEEDVRVCPECGVENDLDAAFCKKCGTKMEGEE